MGSWSCGDGGGGGGGGVKDMIKQFYSSKWVDM